MLRQGHGSVTSDQQTNHPTDKPTDGREGSQGSYTSKNKHTLKSICINIPPVVLRNGNAIPVCPAHSQPSLSTQVISGMVIPEIGVVAMSLTLVRGQLKLLALAPALGLPVSFDLLEKSLGLTLKASASPGLEPSNKKNNIKT